MSGQGAGLGSIRVVSEVRIEAPPERVWRALTEETNAWWPKGFFARPESTRMVFEPRVGGRQYEDCANGEGVLWGVVYGIKAPHSLQLAGDLFPEFGGPARLLTTYTLKADGVGTALRLVDCAFGVIGEKLQESLESGWKTILQDSLKPYVEGKKA